jgi:uncharacterized protein (TIGR00251 family)
LTPTPFLHPTSQGVTIELRVQPRARKTMLQLSNTTLKVSVAAPPVDGKANAAILALLAETWGVPKSALSIVKGRTSRTKRVAMAGDPAVLSERIRNWVKANG